MAERFFANHVGNIRIGIFGPLDFGLDDFHFVQVFDESFRTRIIYNYSFPAGAKGNLAPLTSVASVQLHVDEAALAVYRAPMANCLLRSHGLVS